MNPARRKLYVFLFLACLIGIAWLIFQASASPENGSYTVCLIKQVTTLPCPSCGSTRSVLLLLKGEFMDAWLLNPMGYVVFAILLVTPFWIALDFIFQKNSLFDFFKQVETVLSRKFVFIPLILLMIGNWIWNIMKGL